MISKLIMMKNDKDLFTLANKERKNISWGLENNTIYFSLIYSLLYKKANNCQSML